MARRLAPVLLIALALLAAGGCGGDGDDGGTTAQTTAIETETAPAETETETHADTETDVGTTTGAEPQPTLAITVVGGRPQGGIARLTVDQGDRVVIRVTSDLADEVHVHGYDVEWKVGPGRAKSVVVQAKVPGRFEVELHETGTQIGELTVNP